MRLCLHTNLDEAQEDVALLQRDVTLSTHTHPVPRKGERLRFYFERDGRKCFDLQVVGVVYDYAAGVINVELHMAFPHDTVTGWTEWFKRHRFGKEW